MRRSSGAPGAMTAVAVVLLLVACGLAWWVIHRAARLRREAANREAQVFEALFVARQSADGAANIDLDPIFGGKPPAPEPTASDAVLRAAGLQADVIALLGTPRPPPSVSEPASDAGVAEDAGTDSPDSAEPQHAPAAAPIWSEPAAGGTKVAVRDLVQVFYEARGFRATPAEASAHPIEMVLAHKSDARRAYAFVPLAESLTEAAVESIIGQARRINQLRVLIASEGTVAPELGAALPARGVRAFDRDAIDAQFARLHTAMAEKLRAAAKRRSARRMQSA